jgi:hypothetical protein
MRQETEMIFENIIKNPVKNFFKRT